MVLGVGPFLAVRLIESGTTTARVAGVLIGAASVVPWIGVAGFMISRSDEFVRRLHLISIAWAFAGSIVLIVTLQWMVEAAFIAPPNLLIVWFGFLLIWMVAYAVVKWRYERGR